MMQFSEQLWDFVQAQFETTMQDLKLNVSITTHRPMPKYRTLYTLGTRPVGLFDALYGDNIKRREFQSVEVSVNHLHSMSLSSFAERDYGRTAAVVITIGNMSQTRTFLYIQ